MKLNALFFQQEKELFLLLASQPTKNYLEVIKKELLKRFNRVQDEAFLFGFNKDLFAIFERALLEINSEFRSKK